MSENFTPALLQGPLRAAITSLTRRAEPELMPGLLQQAKLSDEQASSTHTLALRIARKLRERARDSGRAGLVQGLLQEFALSSQEGVALMCLAEALLRIPDAATRDALIRDKVGSGNWQSHLGQSESLFVNAAAWGLLLTGKLVATHSNEGLGAALRRMAGRGGEPLIRKGVDIAMRMMGEQFVTGETIDEALQRAKDREAEGFRYSYDMLGEAALTAQDAARYLAAYEKAIHAIGKAAAGRGIYDGPGISIKLSALHPRYSRTQVARVMQELYPRLLKLAALARQYDIGLNIDAEESERLELSLDLLEKLCFEQSLTGWNGIGFVIQGYQKRCPAVIDYIIDLARRSKHRLMIRLVKGAYWDSEIKRAQIDGQNDYPVYTRKVYTDVAYLACVRKLLAAPDAVFPQFATHNAHTLAAIHTMAGQNYYAGQYEFQCLHGMGEPLYEQVVGSVAQGKLGRPCRIYAPVGTHDTLLAYLVRRLLENGANTSFVNRIADEDIPLEELVQDPVKAVQEMGALEGKLGLPHPAIALPQALFGAARVNSQGMDLANEMQLTSLAQRIEQDAAKQWIAAPMLESTTQHTAAQPLRNPANTNDIVGQVQEATVEEVNSAIASAVKAQAAWAATSAPARAKLLERAADKLEAEAEALISLLMREAGKTCANAVSEIREAVDFLRFYAQQVKQDFDHETHTPLGTVVCIRPWNFPLAIFTGQVAAALAAGNTVIAKPAEQTPLIAAQAVQLLWDAGVPRAVLQLLPGRGEVVGAALTASDAVQGVLFTGSTEVARILQRTVASRQSSHQQPITLIAETGGQNALIVDSSALAEQAANDIMNSAFDSAGQRCSALRVLCVQSDVAERVMEMIKGAMQELQVGSPRLLSTDVGPVIDAEAKENIERHIAAMKSKGRPVYQLAQLEQPQQQGHFVPPTLIEIEHLSELQREVFGPVLHVLRYKRDDLDELVHQINATGYGLTFGVHTRIDETILRVSTQVKAGNVYVNRNMVGAVVGVQPFGGEGLSGTGPKAGGPLYLLRLLAQCPSDAAQRSIEASSQYLKLPLRELKLDKPATTALQTLRIWALQQQSTALAQYCQQLMSDTPITGWRTLAGPTGEANLYRVSRRSAVLCLAQNDTDRLLQLAAAQSVGSRAVWPAAALALHTRLPEGVRERISIVQDWQREGVHFDAVLHHGPVNEMLQINQLLAQRAGPIVSLSSMKTGSTQIPLERLVVEHSLSINTAAAGGNASLMTIG